MAPVIVNKWQYQQTTNDTLTWLRIYRWTHQAVNVTLSGKVLLPRMVKSHHLLFSLNFFSLQIFGYFVTFSIDIARNLQWRFRSYFFLCPTNNKSIQFLLIFKICKSQKGFVVVVYFWMVCSLCRSQKNINMTLSDILQFFLCTHFVWSHSMKTFTLILSTVL